MRTCGSKNLSDESDLLLGRMDCRIKSGNDDYDAKEKRKAERRQTCLVTSASVRCGTRRSLSAFACRRSTTALAIAPFGTRAATSGQASWDVAATFIR
jgi:hypothetical protein